MQRAAAFGVLDQPLLHVGDADPRDPGRGAFQIMRLLAIELHEGAGIFQHLFFGRDAHQGIGDAHIDAAIAADQNVIAGFDADHANVLDGGFGAIARAARDRELDLVRRPGAPAHFFQLDAQAGRILGAEAAPFAADAGLHGAQPLGIGMAGHQPALLRSPHTAGRSSFFTPSRSMRWPPVTLTVGMLNFSATDGDGVQLRRRGDAAPHARHDASRCRPSGCWRARAH